MLRAGVTRPGVLRAARTPSRETGPAQTLQPSARLVGQPTHRHTLRHVQTMAVRPT